MKTKAAILFCLLAFVTLSTAAQDEPEYRLELGAGAAMAAYQGDCGGGMFKKMQPLGALVAKYKPNPRTAWGAQLGFGKLKGASQNIDTWYPDLSGTPVEFNTSITNFDLRFEYNFWAFGTGREYRGARKLTPFITLGMGLIFASAKVTPLGQGEPRSEKPVAFQLPFGFGVKYKLANRLNLTVDWTMHFTGSDRLDGLKDPYGIKSTGIFKNTDCFTLLQASVTYDLWAKCKTCHNDRE